MRRVTIQYHHEADGWWAESREVAGFSAAASDFNTLRTRAIEALAEILDEPFVISEHPPTKTARFTPDTHGEAVSLDLDVAISA